MKKYQTYIAIGSLLSLIVVLTTYGLMQDTQHLNPLESPNGQHWLGTDQLGRDFLVRLIVGSLVTLSLTGIVILLSVCMGLIFGLFAGIERRWLDQIIMFVADMLLAIPSFIIALVILSLVSNSMIGLILALTIGWIGRYLRYFRNLTRDIQKRPFVQYARLSGNSTFKTTVTHVIPHLLSNIFALVTADFGKMMLSISGLAFLGLGIKPPTPELGTILFDGKSYFNGAPWLFFFPGLLLGGCALLNKTDAVFQDVQSNMFQNITLAKHFQYIYEANRTHLTKQRIKEDVLQMMQLLGLRQGEQLLERYPFELSGGMAQRVAFIMSLIRRPDYLFLDEPTSALDQENIKKFMHYLLKAQERYQMTIVFITHDINLVKDCATHISIMQQGQLIENGEATSILTKPTHNYTKKLITIAHRRQPYA